MLGAESIDDTLIDPADLAPPLEAPASDARGALRERMQKSGQWQANQMAGRRWPVACVSLEITQRCNLDCTLCYLSESSEAVRDLPLEEVFRRIDMIHAHYGPGTDVQVSGGEPTTRNLRPLKSSSLAIGLFEKWGASYQMPCARAVPL